MCYVKRDEDPIQNDNGYTNATFLGRNSTGQEHFMGHLSQPLIVNERVVPDEKSNKINNGISGLPSLCRNPSERSALPQFADNQTTLV